MHYTYAFLNTIEFVTVTYTISLGFKIRSPRSYILYFNFHQLI